MKAPNTGIDNENCMMLFRTMSLGVVFFNGSGKISDANPAAERILGLSPDQMMGRSAFDPDWFTIHEDGSDFPGDTHPSIVAIRTGLPVENVVMGVFNPARQTHTWLLVSAVPVFREGGYAPSGAYATFEEITALHDALKKLREQEEQYRLLAETMIDVVWSLDADTLRFTYISPSVFELRGYRAEEVMNHRIDETVMPYARETILKAIRVRAENCRTRTNHQSFYIDEVEQPRKDGTTVRTETITTFNLHSRSGKIEIRGVTRDVTRRWKAEMELKRINGELQARTEELDAFSHTVAHDLINPVSSIMGYSELLDQVKGKEHERIIRNIQFNATKMNSIIKALLLLAGIRHDAAPAKPVEMKGILLEAIKRNDDLLLRTRAEIRYPETLPPALGNGQWIEEVWVNFLSNALKYGGSPPAIQVGSDEASEGMIRFWVKDNGNGIKPESLDAVFKPFTRLSQADIRGFGLGLSIARRIIERLGGSCGVESTGIPGEGSLFWFTLRAPGNETYYD